MQHENERQEFKREFTADKIRKTVVAFANTEGGTLWIGIGNDGKVVGVPDPDGTALQIVNLVRDSIRPDLSFLVRCGRETRNGKTVLRVDVERGTDRPYYVKATGLRPEGVFVRQGPSSAPASETRIRDLLRESEPDGFETGRCLRQDLTFKTLSAAFAEKGLPFGVPQQKTLALRRPDGLFTNLAELLSDQCRPTIKLAAYRGTDKTGFRDRREPSGSLLDQLEQSMAFLEKWNDLRSSVRRLEREDSWDYDAGDVREALLNAVVHRDYSRPDATLASVFPDRLEIVSIGGIVPGYDPADILEGGTSALRNHGLARVFERLRLIESYGTGIRRIRESYAGFDPGPQFAFFPHVFRVVLPNRNAARPSEPPSATPAISARPSPAGPATPREAAVLALFADRPDIGREDVQRATGVSLGTAIRDLRALLDAGRLVKTGAGRRTRYVLPRKTV